MGKSKNNSDIAGNAMASAQAVTRQLVQVSEQLYRAERVLDRMFEENEYIKNIKFRAPTEENNSWLVVVTGEIEGADVVAFVYADTFAEASRMLWAMLENRSIKWKEDQFGTR